jgi:hypothetical protein
MKYDGSEEYMSFQELHLFCKENDIKKQLTIPYMLEKIVYGIVEKRNQTLIESL